MFGWRHWWTLVLFTFFFSTVSMCAHRSMARNFCALGKVSFLRPHPFPPLPFSLLTSHPPSLPFPSSSLPCPFLYTSTLPHPFPFWGDPGYKPGEIFEISDVYRRVSAHSSSRNITLIIQHFLAVQFTFSSILKILIWIPFPLISISFDLL